MVKKIGTALKDILQGTNLADELVGLGGNDTLFGKNGDDLLKGGAGNDKLHAGRGADTVRGGAGDDTIFANEDADADLYHGGGGIDTVDYGDATGSVQAYLDANMSGLNAVGDSYIAVENVRGGAFADYLQAGDNGMAIGRAGDDHLYGADGTEVLRGDQGFDHMYMSYGAGDIAWVQNGLGYDTIHDFVEGDDLLRIDLSEFGLGASFDADEIRSNDSGTAVGAHAQFIFENDTFRLWFDSNGTGAGGRILIAEFDAGSFAIDDGVPGLDLGLNDFDVIA
jgi:Ca2+-binding RTX toxin-like protein